MVSDRARVLVASADEGTRFQVRMTLADERFDLREAGDTDEVVLEVARTAPDLLVVDAGLPGAGALALARTLRGQPATSRVRTLLLTGRGDEPAGEPPGIDSTLGLPVTGFALLRKVDALLGAL